MKKIHLISYKIILSGAVMGFSMLPLSAQQTEVTKCGLVINEVQVSNLDQWRDASFNFGGWIELFNGSAEEVNLNGYILKDGEGNSYTLTADNGIVPAWGFKVIGFDHHAEYPVQADMKLDGDGGTISICNPGGDVVNSVTYPECISRTSYFRSEDGGDKWLITATPTPGHSNNMCKSASERLDEPVPDHDGCLFVSPFNVQVQYPEGSTLYYTLDGKAPTVENGMISTDGIFSIDKTTTLRMVAVEDGKIPSRVVTRSYIYRDKDYKFPTVCVSIDNDFLYDDSIGVYVKGVNGTTGSSSHALYAKGNYYRDWDRACNVEFIDADGACRVNQEGDYANAGSSSRSHDLKGFKVNVNKKFDGHNYIEAQGILDRRPYLKLKSINVRAGGNDQTGRIKDGAIQEMVEQSGLYLDHLNFQPVNVFYNGKFMGILNQREASNDKFAYSNYGIDDEEIDCFERDETDKLYHPTCGDSKTWDELIALSANAKDEATYQKIRSMLDVDEFINYMAAELYICGHDWPHNNTKYFRERTDNGKFHFVFFDTDAAFSWMNTNPFKWIEGNILNFHVYDFTDMLRNLMNNETFRRQFIDAFCMMGGSVFAPDYVTKTVDNLYASMVPGMVENLDGLTSGVEDIKSEFTDSHAKSMTDDLCNWSYSQLRSNDMINVTITTDLPESRLKMNTLEVPTNNFSGRIFKPVTFSIDSPGGYTFKGWDQNGQIISTENTLSPEANGSFKATFERNANYKETVPPVVVNEVSADNSIFMNDALKRSDWIELYNTTDEPFDIAGCYISDNAKKPHKYQIQEAEGVNTIIPAHGFLVIWADKNESKTLIHTGFKLDNSDGQAVMISAPDDSWSSMIEYDAHDGKMSVGRYPDGAATAYVMNRATIEKSNHTTTYDRHLISKGVIDYVKSQTPTSVQNKDDVVSRQTEQTKKYIKDSNIYIEHQGVTYNIVGIKEQKK